MPFQFQDTELPDVKIADPTVFEDRRGRFMETYVRDAFIEAGIDAEFVQDNYSESEAGVLRGLHYQLGADAQAKLVQCTSGAIFDVVVDLRRDSPTFGESLATILTGRSGKMLFVPRGFAHGFFALAEGTATRYKVDNYYAPEAEVGIHWDDPTLDIEWPTRDPVVSDKDAQLPSFEDAVADGRVF